MKLVLLLNTVIFMGGFIVWSKEGLTNVFVKLVLLLFSLLNVVLYFQSLGLIQNVRIY